MPFLASEGCFWPLTASTASEAKINYAYVTTKGIINTYIEVILFCGMYGLAAKLAISQLINFGLLMRFPFDQV